ncbi:MAG: carbohydrate binding family 9 domain-containing protein [Bacteroidales bacterium]|nr:carbohydrate binding family 9 domain-containing protein [Bacteroidales bacterium]
MLLLFLTGPASLSQINSTVQSGVEISKLTYPLNFDGIPDEKGWNSAFPLKMTMHSPSYGKEPSEETDVRFAYDEKYLYMGARICYKDISMIRSASYKRDYTGLGGDLFGFILDTYNDNENGVVFYTTPDGLRFDASIQRDAVLTRPDQKPMNLSWNAFWDVRTATDEKGWTAEIRVPLSSLRFQQTNGIVRMGLIVRRWIPAKNEIDTYPVIPPDWGEYSTIKPSKAQDIILRNVKPAKPLNVAPYGMTGYEKNNDLNEEGTAYWNWDKKPVEAGLDVKYGLSSNLILDLTVNTDFAQVEADDEKINLTRMALYFPEKRLFFLERASIFDFNSSGNNNLFYSRRIGLSDDEENPDPIRIYGGAKLTGRINKLELGVLDMQTAPLLKKTSSGVTRELVPSENFGVIRIRRQVLNENSYLGAIYTSRLGTDGSYNLSYGMDGIFRVFGSDYLTLLWSQTFRDSVRNSTPFEPARFMLLWERRSRKGLGYDFAYSQSGIHYNPGIGFETIEDVITMRGSLRYGWLPGVKSPVFSHGPEFRFRYNRYIIDGSLMTWNPQVGWSFQTKSQWMGYFSLIYNYENLKDPLEIIPEEVYVEPGRYRFVNFRSEVSTPQSKALFTLFSTETGQYFGGSRVSFRLEPTWNMSRHLEIGGTYNFDHINLPAGNILMTNHIIGIKALYMLNTKFSISTFIQHNTADHSILTNFRIRYNPSEGNDLYFMFNEGRNTSLTREEPNLPLYNSRSVMVKYTYTFNFSI